MGSYVYKVTGKKVKLTNGEYANLAVFAYNPVRSGYGMSMDEADKMNNKAYYASGCYYADQCARDGKRTGLIVTGTERGDAVYRCSAGVFHEYSVLNNEKNLVEGVTVAGRETKYKWFDVTWEDKTVEAAGVEKMLATDALEACNEVLKYLARTNPVEGVKISATRAN